MKNKATIAGYHFEQPSLLEEALSHPSLSGRENYQRLEFLGDRVVALVLAEWLLALFPGEPEGRLNRRLVSLVRGESLADMADQLGFTARMKLAPGAEQEGTREKMAVRADIFEAVVGAMYLDGGFVAVRDFLRTHFAERMSDGPDVSKDAKTRLQEWAQKNNKALPRYQLVGRTGPDHNPSFEVEARLEGPEGQALEGIAGRGAGSSKKIAEQVAADALMALIVEKDL